MVLPNITTLSIAVHFSSDYQNCRAIFFDLLRRLNSYLRSQMSEERLNGLVLTYIHQTIATKMNANEVLDIFSIKYKRKLSLLNI